MTKTQRISALILAAYRANGGDIEAATDAVCGKGTYRKLAHDVWTAARAKAGL